PIAKDWDIIALQEPSINTVRNTISTRHFHTVYPSTCYSAPDKASRAITLISSALNTNSWSQLPFPSQDVVVIQLTGPYGKCMILNIYNDGKSPATLTLL
ncbi:hypothetical protein PAXRUDRAFT_46602, partial [Paxillus rubicundulus Ve08.2h10]